MMLGLIAASLGAQAQTPPDAGSLRRQIEQEQQPAMPSRKGGELIKPGAVELQPGAARVLVQGFMFTGNRLLTEADLQAVTAPWIGQSLDVAALRGVAAEVGQAYRNRGWVVRTLLPRQEVKDGVVRIEIVEAVFGKLDVEGTPAGRVPLALVQALAGDRLRAGQPVNAKDLDRGLLLADDLPGVVVSGRLQAGRQENETDLALKLLEEPLLTGEATLDNFGSRGTGATRASGHVSLNSPARRGDLASASVIHTQGSDFLRAAYTVPMGTFGLRLGADASWFRYKLVQGQFQALDSHGNSSSLGAHASLPVIRSRTHNLYVGGSYAHRRFDNEANGGTVSRYAVDDLTVSGNFNSFDEHWGGGSNSASLSLVGSRVNLNGSPNALVDATGARVAGVSVKLRYALSRQQAITDRLSFYASVSGQEADRNQDSSEKFYLGGPYGVRAYPNDEGAGSQGTLATMELRARLPDGFTGAAFYDWGQVRAHVDNAFVGAPALNRYSLKGMGLSVAWQAPWGVGLKVTYARRIGANPNPTPQGKDQDGSLVRNRFWLSAVLPF